MGTPPAGRRGQAGQDLSFQSVGGGGGPRPSCPHCPPSPEASHQFLPTAKPSLPTPMMPGLPWPRQRPSSAPKGSPQAEPPGPCRLTRLPSSRALCPKSPGSPPRPLPGASLNPTAVRRLPPGHSPLQPLLVPPGAAVPCEAWPCYLRWLQQQNPWTTWVGKALGLPA